jgi:hypothetical protein
MSGREKLRLVDWEYKRDICRHVLDISGKTIGDLVEEVIKDTPEYLADDELVTKITQAARKWPKSTPDGRNSMIFWKRLAFCLDCQEHVSPEMLVSAPIETFINYLTDLKPRALQRLAFLKDMGEDDGEVLDDPHGPVTVGDLANDEELFALWTRDGGLIQTIKKGVAKHRLSIEHYYVDPDSAEGWSELVGREAYPTYDECKFGLRDLLKSEEWRKLVDEVTPSTMVMLAGGGAPTKDVVLIQGLTGRKWCKQVDYYLVDISFFMLMNSRRALRKLLPAYGLADVVNLHLLRDDVLTMSCCDQERFHKRGNVVFGITGGTIGNFSEAKLFDSLDRIALRNDLLIISADTVDGVSDKEKEEVREKYDNPALRDFIRPVVRAVLNTLDVVEPIEDVMDARFKVELLEGEKSASNISGGWSVVAKLAVSEPPITLFTSNRYSSSHLVAYAASRGWESVCRISSPLNSDFKQFLFRRKV